MKVALPLKIEQELREHLEAEAKRERRSLANMLEVVLAERYEAALAEREASGATGTRGDLAPYAVAGASNSGDAYPESAAPVGASRSASAARKPRRTERCEHGTHPLRNCFECGEEFA